MRTLISLSSHHFVRTAFVLGLVGITACSLQRPAPLEKPPIGEVVVSVGDLVVTVSEGIPADSRQQLAETYGVSRLRTAVWAALMREAKLDQQSPRVIEIQITRFRLRPTPLMHWMSMMMGWMSPLMAGVDYLDIEATVRDGGQTVKQYATGAATAGFSSNEESDRLEKLCGTVADRVAEQL